MPLLSLLCAPQDAFRPSAVGSVLPSVVTQEILWPFQKSLLRFLTRSFSDQQTLEEHLSAKGLLK